MKNLLLAISLSLAFSSAGLTPASAQTMPGAPVPSRTKAERDAMTPQQVLASFKAGNERFVRGERKNRDFVFEQRATASGQHPAAVLLSCIDSRAPAEILFDKGIGDTFNARIAGNVLNPDLTGSLEFACAAAGAKLVVVLGHSQCGAIKGAIDHVELGSLTGLLERIHPAIASVGRSVPGEANSKNAALVTAVTRANVVETILALRRTSPILRDLEAKGTIIIVGAIYDIETGRVEFLEITP